MASLRKTSTGKTLLLEPEHVVGRAPTCALRLSPLYVSAQHALFRWIGQHWEIRDLGSSNGTFLNGVQLSSGKGYSIKRGARIAFGNIEEQWELADESPPSAMAIPLEGGDPVVAQGDLLALPSDDDPRVTLYRGADGAWLLEQTDEQLTPIANMQLFKGAERVWRFCCPDSSCPPTEFAASPLDKSVRNLGLSFAVSSNEEFVHLDMHFGGQTFDMGNRSFNYLLLTLARHRLESAEDGLDEAECGWVDQGEYKHDPSMSPPQLNVDVFRIRRLFAAHGVVDAGNIIERRPSTQQLRIGTGRLTVAPR